MCLYCAHLIAYSMFGWCNARAHTYVCALHRACTHTFNADRMPRSAMTFLLTLATVDDLGAILVIAALSASKMVPCFLALAVSAAAVLALLERCGVERGAPLLALGACLWWCLLQVAPPTAHRRSRPCPLVPPPPLWPCGLSVCEFVFPPAPVPVVRASSVSLAYFVGERGVLSYSGILCWSAALSVCRTCRDWWSAAHVGIVSSRCCKAVSSRAS
jgi:hypothetical protein